MSDTDIIVHVETSDQNSTYRIDANVAYVKIRGGIEKFMGGSPADATTEAGRLSSLVRVGVKGVLLMYGDKILDSIFGSKEHPRPGKKDDLVNWYTDMFTKVVLANLVKNVTILSGVKDESDTRITEIHTRPNTESAL